MTEHELATNGHMGDFATWQPTPEQVLWELHHHVAKLHVLFARGVANSLKVTEYAADVANFAMKIAEQYGGAA